MSTLLCESFDVLSPVKIAKTAATRPYHHGNLRQSLIDAGLELIAEKGVRAFTLREIGSRIGVSRMAAYRHFADKSALLRAISDAGFVAFADALEAACRTAKADFASQLSSMALAYVRFAVEHRAQFEVMFAWGDVDAKAMPSEAGRRAFGLLVQTIQDGQQAGAVREGDTITLARVAWVQVHGISLLNLEPDLSPGGKGTRFVLLCSEILRRGLAPGSNGKPRRGSRSRGD